MPNSSYLTASLAFVLLTAFLHFFVVTLQRAVVGEKILELIKEILEILIVRFVLHRQGCELIIQGIYIRFPQHFEGFPGKAYACPEQMRREARPENIQSSEEEKVAKVQYLVAPFDSEGMLMIPVGGENKFVASWQADRLHAVGSIT